MDYTNVSQKLEVLEAVSKKFLNIIFRIGIANQLNDIGVHENNLWELTVPEVIGKIREFVASNPSDENYEIFLRYLASYPVSMCKRKVSPLLKFIIGMHYRLGVPDKENKEKGVKAVSYDELAEIFGRSKATIYECVHDTEDTWKEMQQELEKEKAEAELRDEARQIALQQLIEEEKAKIKAERNNQI